MPYWSLQKLAGGAAAASSPRIERAAGGAEPRGRLPVVAADDVARGVDARDDGAAARRRPRRRSPASGDPASQRVSGATPTRGQGRRRPRSPGRRRAGATPRARRATRRAAPPPGRRPARRARPPRDAATRTSHPGDGPSTRASGASAASITVTSTPSAARRGGDLGRRSRRRRSPAARPEPARRAAASASATRAQLVHVRAPDQRGQPPRRGSRWRRSASS